MTTTPSKITRFISRDELSLAHKKQTGQNSNQMKAQTNQVWKTSTKKIFPEPLKQLEEETAKKNMGMIFEQKIRDLGLEVVQIEESQINYSNISEPKVIFQSKPCQSVLKKQKQFNFCLNSPNTKRVNQIIQNRIKNSTKFKKVEISTPLIDEPQSPQMTTVDQPINSSSQKQAQLRSLKQQNQLLQIKVKFLQNNNQNLLQQIARKDQEIKQEQKSKNQKIQIHFSCVQILRQINKLDSKTEQEQNQAQASYYSLQSNKQLISIIREKLIGLKKNLLAEKEGNIQAKKYQFFNKHQSIQTQTEDSTPIYSFKYSKSKQLMDNMIKIKSPEKIKQQKRKLHQSNKTLQIRNIQKKSAQAYKKLNTLTEDMINEIIKMKDQLK